MYINQTQGIVRGKIRNRKFAQQLRDFSGLRFGTITPTDIDAFIDFGGRLFVFIESKHGSAGPPFGQRLALERLCDSCQSGGVTSFVIISYHNEDGDVDFASTIVREFRYMGGWHRPKTQTTTRKAIETIRGKYDKTTDKTP